MLVLAAGCHHSASKASAHGSAAVMAPPMRPDQANTARWDKAWTNLVNDVEQGFTPTLPRLEAVEVALVVGNPGPSEDVLTLTVLDTSGQVLSSVSKTVQAEKCDPVLFVIPTAERTSRRGRHTS